MEVDNRWGFHSLRHLHRKVDLIMTMITDILSDLDQLKSALGSGPALPSGTVAVASADLDKIATELAALIQLVKPVTPVPPVPPVTVVPPVPPVPPVVTPPVAFGGGMGTAPR